jgi:hypothetical protein
MTRPEQTGLLLFVLLALALMSIFQKAGYSRWLGLLIIVPVANIVVLLLLVFGDWPVRRQLRYLKMRSGDASDEDAYDVLGDASRLERKGQFDAAMERYQEIATRFAGRPPGLDAGNYIQTLRRKM